MGRIFQCRHRSSAHDHGGDCRRLAVKASVNLLPSKISRMGKNMSQLFVSSFYILRPLPSQANCLPPRHRILGAGRLGFYRDS